MKVTSKFFSKWANWWFSSFLLISENITQNGANDDLVDEKGHHEDIYEFASKADIIVCCLRLEKETVRI